MVARLNSSAKLKHSRDISRGKLRRVESAEYRCHLPGNLNKPSSDCAALNRPPASARHCLPDRTNHTHIVFPGHAKKILADFACPRREGHLPMSRVKNDEGVGGKMFI